MAGAAAAVRFALFLLGVSLREIRKEICRTAE
jgi:hypothetical protein